MRVRLSASREMEYIASYGQNVRRLVRPDDLDVTTDPIQTYDLVEVWVESDLTEEAAGRREAQVAVRFTSPAGKELEIPARELVNKGPYTTWVARIIPGEAGTWSYRVELLHARLARKGLLLGEGRFDVQDSGRILPRVKREWVETEPVPEGKRVERIWYRPGATVKLEQLIGDWDSHLKIPTLNQTVSDYGYIGTDLGQPFEHNGEIIFLFGDTMGTRGFVESSIGRSSTTSPEEGLRLDFFTDDNGEILSILPPGLSMQGFEVPSGGMSIDGKMYFVNKDQTTVLEEGRTFRSVLIRFDEEKKEFIPVREFSPFRGKFHEVMVRWAPAGTPGLPGDGPHLLIFGSGEFYRKSPLYLAALAPEDIEMEGATWYFAGLDPAGMPVWSRDEADAVPVVVHRVIGEFSVAWCEELRIWLLAYNSSSPRGIVFRWAEQPWGPWSPAEVIFDPGADRGYGHFMHSLSSPDPTLAGPVINAQPPAVEQYGGEYAPYLVERFLRYRDNTLTIYYLMSTWNPYVVVLMRTDLNVVLVDDVR